MNFLIACDSFKGSLSAYTVCKAIKYGIKSELPDSPAVCFPLADGGEGTVESFFQNCGGVKVQTETVNCFFETMTADYLMLNGKTAVIETAAASGIMNVPAEKLNPMKASTYGTGLLIKHAVENGAENIILGLGGSATNDGGVGALNALGIDLLDKNGNMLEPVGENLIKIKDFKINSEFSKYKNIKFTLACDVENVFCGNLGAAYVFARQKGADDRQIEELDKGLDNLADIIYKKLGVNLKTCKGAGAAGGLSGGLLAFLNCEIKSGFTVLAEASDFERQIINADIVITGEGKTDIQTAYGKLPFRVCELAKMHNKPCFLVCGQLEGGVDIKELGFSEAYQLVGGEVTAKEAIADAAYYLTEKGKEIAKVIS
ncbi:MAG: glycerate kinase [Clostridiaceae bacterium]|nr:glycerate kinase [Clostridiaceae bacterium]